MKVVQVLYSYLLTRSRFDIIPAPDAPSRDKRFAHSLYNDLLLLLLEHSGYRMLFDDSNNVRIIAPEREKTAQSFTRIAAALATNDDIRPIAVANRSWIEALAPLRGTANAALKESAIFKEYMRKRTVMEIDDEARLWKTVMRTVLLRDKGIDSLIHSNPDFTLNGYNEALDMFDATLDEYTDVRSSLIDARKSLSSSLDKAYELYHSLLQLMIDLTHMRELQLDEAKHKYLPSHDDLNPNMKFVENRFISALAENADMKSYLEATPISWVDDDVTLRRLLDKIMQSEIYQAYMAEPVSDMEKDCELWYALFKNVIADSDELAEALEAQSIYWNDDLAIMGSFVLKTIRRFAHAGDDIASVNLMPKYKDLEDERFGPKLFDVAVANQQEYRALIDSRLDGSSWDPERLAFMDIVILETAIAELLNFPSIPTVVTVNEYTEIANYYSTLKSGQFVTGMLYGIINQLKSDGTLVKE
jgi:N utilization substance protein B